MLEELKGANIVAGTNQLVKALNAGRVKQVYVASDADVFVARRVTDLCQKLNVPVTEARTMRLLGEACGLEVGAAAAGVLR